MVMSCSLLPHPLPRRHTPEEGETCALGGERIGRIQSRPDTSACERSTAKTTTTTMTTITTTTTRPRN